ncbi:GntR family transcriptional regulator, partial [Acidiphilium iwatense]
MSVADPVVPLHQRIIADLEAKILSGEWPPGYRIPFEHQLVAHYGCARMTVNKAISTLTAAGLIVRRRRAGSFVASPPVQSAVLQIPD